MNFVALADTKLSVWSYASSKELCICSKINPLFLKNELGCALRYTKLRSLPCASKRCMHLPGMKIQNHIQRNHSLLNEREDRNLKPWVASHEALFYCH